MSVENDTYMSIIDPTTRLHEIRSHRKPRAARRYGIVAAAVLACTAVLPLGGGSVLPPAMAVAPATVQPVVVSPVVARGSVVSRSMVRRAAAAPTRAQRITKVVNYALAQRGDRYKFGAAGPSKWDCSGLAMVSYRQIGVKLPHYTGSMLKHGKHIARKNMIKGDLVFPSRGHVGIYLGGNKMVAASSGAGKVKVQTVYAFYAARRII